ncbi:hypothetical protein QBC35DRAFT_532241 [Podospora australis]|uniref:Uncharacterized protein n=1 Tax=Podospora australis TaxID=1536484 RepID=A0AAN6WUK9_9PEZI|nr:hypothetical protein QBC35DRAFT_532241 [Podospora australis]
MSVRTTTMQHTLQILPREQTPRAAKQRGQRQITECQNGRILEHQDKLGVSTLGTHYQLQQYLTLLPSFFSSAVICVCLASNGISVTTILITRFWQHVFEMGPGPRCKGDVLNESRHPVSESNEALRWFETVTGSFQTHLGGMRGQWSKGVV